MYQITIKTKDGAETLLALKTKSRKDARSVKAVAKENELPCEVTVEVEARAVKFKGID